MMFLVSRSKSYSYCTAINAFSPGLWSGHSLALGTLDHWQCCEIWGGEMGRTVICTLASLSKGEKNLLITLPENVTALGKVQETHRRKFKSLYSLKVFSPW